MFLGNFGPVWFHGIDAVIDIVSLLVALLIGVFSYKVYNFTKKRSFLYFFLAFEGISIGLLFKLIINQLFYAGPQTEIGLAMAHAFQPLVPSTPLLILFGRFAYHLVTLGSFFILAAVILDLTDWRLAGLTGFFILLASFTTLSSFLLFHLAVAVLLFFIAQYYMVNFNRRRNKNAAIIRNAFWLLLLSNVLYVLVVFNQYLYVAGEVIQLLGYLLLATGFYRALNKK